MVDRRFSSRRFARNGLHALLGKLAHGVGRIHQHARHGGYSPNIVQSLLHRLLEVANRRLAVNLILEIIHSAAQLSDHVADLAAHLRQVTAIHQQADHQEDQHFAAADHVEEGKHSGQV